MTVKVKVVSKIVQLPINQQKIQSFLSMKHISQMYTLDVQLFGNASRNNSKSTSILCVQVLIDQIIVFIQLQMYKLLLLLLLVASFNSELIQVLTVFRHGSRYPVHNTYDGADTAQDHGQLTSTGMRQHYNLGAILRKQYITDLKFLKTSYNHSEIEVQCTDYNRTQMSAYSFLYGLYPDLTGPKIPAGINRSCLLPPYAGRTDDIDQSTYTLPHGRQIINMKEDWGNIFIDCPKQIDKNKQDNHAAIQEMSTRYGPFLNNMTKLFDQKYPMILMNISSTFDTLVCDQYLNRAFPKTFSDKDYANMRHLHYYANMIKYSNGFSFAVNTPKFKYMFSHFDQSIINPERLFKMGILSCHDTDIIPLQYQLNISNANCIEELYRFNKTSSLNCEPGPQFASSLIFELHKNGSSYNVMIKNNGKYVNLCEAESTSCNYNEFKERIQRNYKSDKNFC